MAKLAHHLNLGPAFLICGLLGFTGFALSTGCGEDAQGDYAGLEVATKRTSDGVGYRVRYASPPWEESSNDPLALGVETTVELAGNDAHPYIKGTSLVLEIERQSIVQQSGTTLAKYRFEAMLIECDVLTSPGVSCAEHIAKAENKARAKKGEASWLADHQVRAATSDFKQNYFELITKNMETRRYKRIAFFETPDPDRYLRVYIEANPTLEDTEVTRMLNAIETFKDENGAPSDSDAGAAP